MHQNERTARCRIAATALVLGGMMPSYGKPVLADEGDPAENAATIMKSYLDPSYITVGGGLSTGGDVGSEDLWFEADLNNHFQVLRINSFLLTLNPRVRLRMYRDDSAPVRTPSFMPGLAAFWTISCGQGQGSSNDSFWYPYLMLSHHSNGQAGAFYAEDEIVASEDEKVRAGHVNTISGSFSTNFIRAGVGWVQDVNYIPTSMEVWTRWHPLEENRTDELDGQYEKVAIGMSFRSAPKQYGLTKTWKYKAMGGISYSWGQRGNNITDPKGANPIVTEVDTHDRVSLELTASARPPWSWTTRLGVFMRYDYGYDYYNIRFQQRLNRLQIGFAADRYWGDE
ncbi:MAG: hypothetical protein CME06_13570 [Gemmatimonadetes bacterium]|nr:hypothetical protein [Gemmatimonadota bacterium]